MAGAFNSLAYGPAFATSQGTLPVPVGGGANPWGERIRKGRELTAEKIRKAKDAELEKILAELQEQGVLPVEVMQAAPDYSEVRQLYSEQLAQIAREATAQWERQWQQQQEEEEMILLMMMH